MRFNLTLEDGIGELIEQVAEQARKNGEKVTVYDLIRQAVVEKYGSDIEINDKGFIRLHPKNMIGYTEVHQDYGVFGENKFDVGRILFFCTSNPDKKIKCLTVRNDFFKLFFKKDENSSKYRFPGTPFGRFYAIKIGTDEYLLKFIQDNRYSDIEDIIVDFPEEEAFARKKFIVDSKFIQDYFQIFE